MNRKDLFLNFYYNFFNLILRKHTTDTLFVVVVELILKPVLNFSRSMISMIIKDTKINKNKIFGLLS